ncbi:MAG: hypothetical protein JWP16_2516 [Alphaproteobacteria bacterium]|nr:hypothetical protein [Alphaproteobacteria bacterium]
MNMLACAFATTRSASESSHMRPQNSVAARTATTPVTARASGSNRLAFLCRKISLISQFTINGTSPLMALVNSMQPMASSSRPHSPPT